MVTFGPAAAASASPSLVGASFTAWSAPLLWAYFDPTGAALYFSQSLGALPDWYVGGYLAITGAVWGVSELKAAGAWKK